MSCVTGNCCIVEHHKHSSVSVSIRLLTIVCVCLCELLVEEKRVHEKAEKVQVYRYRSVFKSFLISRIYMY